MNFEFLLSATDGKIFKIMADVTDKLLSKRMDIIVQQGTHHAFYHPHPTVAECTQTVADCCHSIFDILYAGDGAGEVSRQGLSRPVRLLSKHRFRCHGGPSARQGRKVPFSFPSSSNLASNAFLCRNSSLAPIAMPSNGRQMMLLNWGGYSRIGHISLGRSHICGDGQPGMEISESVLLSQRDGSFLTRLDVQSK